MSVATAPAPTAPLVKSMAMLPCRHCGGQIKSDARRSQCPHCGALFPFVCAVGGRNLRPPFNVFEDERHLTFTTGEIREQGIDQTDAARAVTTDTPQPLSDEHHLRRCPEDGRWFLASENPGFFRCPHCAQNWNERKFFPDSPDESGDKEPLLDEPTTGGIATVPVRSGLNPNTLVLMMAALAFIGLVSWFLIGKG